MACLAWHPHPQLAPPIEPIHVAAARPRLDFRHFDDATRDDNRIAVLALLNEVFEETCANNETALDSPAASNLAKALMAAFENGIQDKAGLLAIVSDASERFLAWAAVGKRRRSGCPLPPQRL
jgi:hypothetical protein